MMNDLLDIALFSEKQHRHCGLTRNATPELTGYPILLMQMMVCIGKMIQAAAAKLGFTSIKRSPTTTTEVWK
jgi:uroporphyrinogen-III synthase